MPSCSRCKTSRVACWHTWQRYLITRCLTAARKRLSLSVFNSSQYNFKVTPANDECNENANFSPTPRRLRRIGSDDLSSQKNSVLCGGLTRAKAEEGKQGISTQEGCWTGNRWCNVANLSTHRKKKNIDNLPGNTQGWQPLTLDVVNG